MCRGRRRVAASAAALSFKVSLSLAATLLLAQGCQARMEEPSPLPTAPEPTAPPNAVASSPDSAGSIASGAARGGPAAASAPLPAGTARMRERLEAMASSLDPRENPFLNAARVELLRASLSQPLPDKERLEGQIQLGIELLRAGKSQEAATTFEETRPLLASLPQEDARVLGWLLHEFGARAGLRLAEEANCLLHHNADSCLFPITGGGLHGQREGSLAARRHLLAALQERPDDLGSVWLLNIVSMTLGDYPDGVPQAWRIPPERFRSEAEIPRFRDVAQATGTALIGRSGGAALEDFSGDGLLDIVASSWGPRDPLRYLVNDGRGAFVERTREAGLEGIVGGLNLVHADYDNDGHPDLLVLRGAWMHEQGRQPNSLLHNLGDAFEDVTEAAGMLSLHPTQTAAWADYDGDGWLDLFIGNESLDEDRNPCELYHNDGNGSFTECAGAAGLAWVGFVKGAAWGDFDDDGRPDLYLSCLGEPNHLFHNAGPGAPPDRAPPDVVATGAPPARRDAALPARPWRFVDVTERAGVAEPLASFPVWVWDFDQDGREDLLVLGYGWKSSTGDVAADYLGRPSAGARPKLYRNLGDLRFADVTGSAGLDHVLIAMGANFGDINNDGYPDALVGTGEPSLDALMPNRMFLNIDGERFADVTTAGGFGHLQKGHGIAFGDIDQDGDQDIYAVLGGAYEADVFPNILLENPGPPRHWIALLLEGVRANRFGLGARIEVDTREARQRRTVYATVGTGGSFGSSSLQAELGLGDAEAIEEVRIRWPGSNSQQSLRGLPLDAAVAVREGVATFQVLQRERLHLGGSR